MTGEKNSISEIKLKTYDTLYSLLDQVGISMSMSSMLEEPSLSNSEMTNCSKEGDGLDLNNIPIAQGLRKIWK